MRNGKRKTDIIIDLTSLLDVVFIVLLVVMCYQFANINKYEALADDAQTSQEILDNKSNAYDHAIETQDNINQFVFAVNVQSNYEEQNYKERHLSVIREGKEIVSWELSGNDTVEKYAEFEQTLDEYISEIPDNPILLSLNEDDANILYRDEQKILDIFGRLTDKYSNVYVRSSIDNQESE